MNAAEFAIAHLKRLEEELVKVTKERDAYKDKLEKAHEWFVRQAEASAKQARETRFLSIADAARQDAKNFKATANDIYSVLKEFQP